MPTPPVSGSSRAASSPHCASASQPTGAIFAESVVGRAATAEWLVRHDVEAEPILLCDLDERRSDGIGGLASATNHMPGLQGVEVHDPGVAVGDDDERRKEEVERP